VRDEMIKVTDYICNYIASKGIRDAFMISGGGAMHLVDSFGKHPKLKYICPHHEQAAAIAAEGYARAFGRMAAVVVTSGPGGTNTLTGVIGQWLDSVPALYLSGQVKQETTIESCRKLGLRQLGDQEINIVDIVRPVTKYAAIVDSPDKIRFYLEKAIYKATHGRPGPVWLDIPLNIQGAMINEKCLEAYSSQGDAVTFNKQTLKKQVERAISALKKAERPVIIAGQGIRISGCHKEFRKFVKDLRIPALTTFGGVDTIHSDHPNFTGRLGSLGTRFGNFALQNSDVLLSVGTRNNIRQIGYNWRSFAREAFKISVDIDKAELKKPTLHPNVAIHADVRDFLSEMNRQMKKATLPSFSKWNTWCQERRSKYPVVLAEYWKEKGRVNPYCFIETLTKALPSDAILVSGNGMACVGLYQCGIVKKDQRVFWNSGCASMGYDLPAAVGACCANGRKQTICLTGDGSIQMNIQELQTIVHNKLPIKIFVLNNDGYLSIRQTQDSFFSGRYAGSSTEGGVSCPDIIKVAKAYGMKSARVTQHQNMNNTINEVLGMSGAVLCEVVTSPTQKFVPKMSSEKKPDGRLVSKPLEDMYPFLPREEFYENMLIKPLQE